MKFKIIRLKNNEISERYALDCVNEAKKYNVHVEFFDAINGLNYQHYLNLLELKPKYKFKKGRAGVFGCFLSHYFLWQSCIKDNIPYLILEHDGFFIKPLPSNILDTFTDVLKLDRLDPYSKNYTLNLEIEKELAFSVENYHNPTAKFLEKNQTGNYLRGAYSYIIKPHAAIKIVNWIKSNGFVPADQQIGNAIVDIKTTIPTIVRLHPDYQNKIGELSLTGNPNLL